MAAFEVRGLTLAIISGGGAMVTLERIFQIAGNICTHNLDFVSQWAAKGVLAERTFPKGGLVG